MCLFIIILCYICFIFFFKQKTAYELRISDWSSDVCSSDLRAIIGVYVNVNLQSDFLSPWGERIEDLVHQDLVGLGEGPDVAALTAATRQQAAKFRCLSPKRRGNASSRRLRDLGDDLLCRVAQIVGRNDRQARAREDVLALLDVRALETDDERNREVHFLRRGDDALGDDVALHDAAEDVDEDAFDRGVLQNDLEDRKST